MTSTWREGGGSRKKVLKCERMWMLKGGVTLNVWVSARKKLNYKKERYLRF